jgi:hypothetical protein
MILRGGRADGLRATRHFAARVGEDWSFATPIEKGQGMQKLFFGALFVSVNAALLGLLARDIAVVHPAILAGVATIFNLVCGIRIGFNSADAHLRDVVRLNHYLADQNESLLMSNREILERLASSPLDAAEDQGVPARTRA